MPVGFAASICVWEAFVFMYYEVRVFVLSSANGVELCVAIDVALF